MVDKTGVILSAAKDLGGIALRREILRCAQDDGWAVNGYARQWHSVVRNAR